MGTVLIRQRAYLLLLSDELTIDQISEVMGCPPTTGVPKGSIQTGPPIRPRFHQWILESGTADERPLNEHLGSLWRVLELAADQLRAFTARKDSSGSMRIDRQFMGGVQTSTKLAVVRFDRIAKHPTLGFDLSLDHINLLASIGFDLAVDEDEDSDP
jgi:hypothetical protein